MTVNHYRITYRFPRSVEDTTVIGATDLKEAIRWFNEFYPGAVIKHVVPSPAFR